MKSKWVSQKEAVLDTAREMLKLGLTVGKSGNVSMRLDRTGDRDVLAITPTDRHYEYLSSDDIVIVDFQGERVEGRFDASMETSLHVEIYRARKNISAVIHCHPVFTSVLSVIRRNLPPILDDQVCYLGGEIQVSEYALPGSNELVRNTVAALGYKNAVIMANHGAVALGSDLKDAITNSCILEQAAKVYIHSLSAGKVTCIPADALDAEYDYFRSQYGKGQWK